MVHISQVPPNAYFLLFHLQTLLAYVCYHHRCVFSYAVYDLSCDIERLSATVHTAFYNAHVSILIFLWKKKCFKVAIYHHWHVIGPSVPYFYVLKVATLRVEPAHKTKKGKRGKKYDDKQAKKKELYRAHW